MKKILPFLAILCIAITTLSSCSSDNESSTVQNKLVKKIVEVNTDVTSSTYNFTYNGDKIVSINSAANTQSFTYTGNLITKISEFNNLTQLQTTFDYTYNNDNKLIKVICSNNYELNYAYNTDGTISFGKTTHDTNGNVVLVFHGVLSFVGDNVSKITKIMDDTPVTVRSEEEVSFTYDNKKNPFSAILGYSKLLDHYKNCSVNNTKMSTETATTTYLDTNQVVSSLVQHSSTFQYDNNGYPTEIVSDNSVFDDQNTNHLKSLYFYE